MNKVRPLASWVRRAIQEGDPDFLFTQLSDNVKGFIKPVVRPYCCSCGLSHQPDSGLLAQLDRPIVFVFEAGTRPWGSVHLRVEQTLSLLDAIGVNRIPLFGITTKQLQYDQIQGSLVIFTKTAFSAIDESLLKRLKQKGNKLLLDNIDGGCNRGLETYIDVFLCASISEYNMRVNEFSAPSLFVPHAIDQRIKKCNAEHRIFSCAYAGSPVNAVHLAELPQIQAIRLPTTARRGSHRLAWAEELCRFSHHYIVRKPSGWHRCKPFTKAYIAAAMGACAVASADDEEALQLLGKDYPYMAASSSLEDVTSCLHYSADTFHGPAWHVARSFMIRMEQLSCPIAVGNRFLYGFLLAQNH